MTELPYVKPSRAPLRRLTEEEAVAALRDIKPGWYTSRDLLPRFQAADSGEKGEITAFMIAACFRYVLQLDREKVSGNRTVFWVSNKSITGRDWFSEPGDAPRPRPR